MSGFEIAAVAVLAAGTAVAANSQYQQARASARAARFSGELSARDAEQQAALREREAEARSIGILEEQQGLEVDLQSFDKQARRFESNQLAIAGASGFELSGSALEVIADSAAELEFEREQVIRASEVRQRRIRDEGTLLAFEAESFRQRADFAREVAGFEAAQIRFAGGLRTFNTLLSGAGNIGFGLAAGAGG